MNISLFQWRRFVYCTEIETRKIKYENEFDDYSAITVNSAPPLDIKNINIRNISWLLSDNGRSPLCPRTSSELSSAVVQTGAGQSACKHFMIFIIFFMIIFYGSVREQTCQMHTLTGSLLTLTLYVHNTDITHRNDSAWSFLPNKLNENLFFTKSIFAVGKNQFLFRVFCRQQVLYWVSFAHEHERLHILPTIFSLHFALLLKSAHDETVCIQRRSLGSHPLKEQ